MNEVERDELLIVVREDVRHIKEWTKNHEAQHKEERERVRKYLYPIYTGLVALALKVMFWN
jgi:hypothetical protein